MLHAVGVVIVRRFYCLSLFVCLADACPASWRTAASSPSVAKCRATASATTQSVASDYMHTYMHIICRTKVVRRNQKKTRHNPVRGLAPIHCDYMHLRR